MRNPFEQYEIKLGLNIFGLRLLMRVISEANPHKNEEDILVSIHQALEAQLRIILDDNR